MAINAVLAIIADGGRAIVVIYTEGEEINYFLLILLILIKPFDGGLVKPLAKRPQRWGMILNQNHGTGGGNGSVMVGMFVCLCLASKKPS